MLLLLFPQQGITETGTNNTYIYCSTTSPSDVLDFLVGGSLIIRFNTN